MSWRSEETKLLTLKTLQEGARVYMFDTETSGLSPERARIVEFAGIRLAVRNGEFIKEKELDFYVRLPDDVVMDEKAFQAHGLSREFLSDKNTDDEAFEEILAFFQGDAPGIVGGYNSGFDIRFVDAIYQRNALSFQPGVNLDVLEMARDLVSKKDSGSHKLGDIAKYFGIEANFHCALDDIEVTTTLMNMFWKEYRTADVTNPDELVKPEIKSVVFWEGFNGFSRIYVNTEAGGFYYDIRRKTWEEKDGSMKTTDMDHVCKQSWCLTGATCEAEFARFDGKIFA